MDIWQCNVDHYRVDKQQPFRWEPWQLFLVRVQHAESMAQSDNNHSHAYDTYLADGGDLEMKVLSDDGSLSIGSRRLSLVETEPTMS